MTTTWHRPLSALAVLAVAAALVLTGAPPGRAQGDLHHCATWTASRCDGSISVPLDRTDPSRGTIDVGFSVLPRADLSQPAKGTVFGAVGGPSGANDLEVWRERLGPLLDRFDLLVMDYRGVGRSTPLRCAALDRFADERGWTPENVAACGEQLRDVLPYYSTAAAADDLDDVRAALGIDRLDVNGQSYGTFFAQVYALRHPERVSSLVLDGVLPLDVDPWERPTKTQPLASMAQVCRDSATCAGDPVRDWTALVERVRRHGGPVTVDDLENLQRLFSSPGIGRELIAATRAALDSDHAPLRRLLDQAQAFRDAVPSGEPLEPLPELSPAQGFAITCNDDPMPFDRAAAPEERRAQFEAARAALPAGSYAPFTVEEATSERFDLSWARLCIDWPTPGAAVPPPPADADYPDVPTLVVSGSLDSATTPGEGQRVAERFPRSRHVVIPFGDHSVGLYGPPCAGEIVTRFVATRDLDAVDPQGCVDTSFRALGTFPRRSHDVRSAGGEGPQRARTIAAAAVATVADAAARRAPLDDQAAVLQGEQAGLRGGTLRFPDQPGVVELDAVRYVKDLAVTGTATRHPEDGTVVAEVRLADRRGRDIGELTVRWDADVPEPVATASGRVRGRTVAVEAAAP